MSEITLVQKKKINVNVNINYINSTPTYLVRGGGYYNPVIHEETTTTTDGTGRRFVIQYHADGTRKSKQVNGLW